MQKRVFFSALIGLLAVLATFAPAGPAQAMTAQEYFEDGNRLFRDDLYWAALLRYRQAAEEGLDTPLLHYNTGVAHYRAGQHVRARASLIKALDDPVLRIAAQYSLGLNAWALGDSTEALRWFQLVRDQQQNQKLQQFAVVAIARIRMANDEPSDYEVLVEERTARREFTDLEFRARLGFGSDDNPFRSPDQPYIDYADPTRPIVVPVVQSGNFVPLNLSAKYKINGLPFEGFFGAYRFNGRYYLDGALENANEYGHEISFGSEYEREDEEKKRERRVFSAFTIARHDEVYYDRDDGVARSVDMTDIDNRMNYVRYGPELYLRQSGERLSAGLELKGQLWNYEDTRVVPEYDHEYFLLGTYGQYRFARTALLRLSARYYSRRFGDRPSYDLDGQQRVGNPGIHYDYLAVGLRARQRITDNMWFGFDVEHTQRTDRHVGYNDYSRDSFGFEFHWRPSYRFNFEFDSKYQLYDYPNAFAFHEPAAGSKTQESLDASLLAEYRMTRHLSLVAEAHLREVVSNDIRIQYARTQYVLGVRWEQ